jgi:hypothetical protein
MITGAHSIIYSSDPEADRRFFKDVLKFPHVDVGDGWLIFALPQSEVAIHPSEEQREHEFYLICDDIKAFVKEMQTQKIDYTKVEDHGWGLITYITLPGGGKVGVYEARHKRPKN